MFLKHNEKDSVSGSRSKAIFEAEADIIVKSNPMKKKKILNTLELAKL
jgi:hypothetical protein